MFMKLFVLCTIINMVVVVPQEISEENMISVQEEQNHAGFWNTFAEIALSEDSFKSWLVQKFEWLAFLVVETIFRLYF